MEGGAVRAREVHLPGLRADIAGVGAIETTKEKWFEAEANPNPTSMVA
jgi:hypothetical protein